MYWDYWQQVMVDIGVVFGGVFEETLMMWICIQFYMFPLNREYPKVCVNLQTDVR